MVRGFFYDVLAQSERNSVFISEFKLIVGYFFVFESERSYWQNKKVFQ